MTEQELIGKIVLVGLSYKKKGKEAHKSEQMYGRVVSISTKGIEVLLLGSNAGKTFFLPPDLDAIFPAQKADYHLRSTGETVSNPDFLTTFEITEKE